MCGVADDNDRRCVMVGLALDTDKGQVGILVERCNKIVGLDESGDAWEVVVEEWWDLIWVDLKSLVHFARCKKRTGKRAVLELRLEPFSFSGTSIAKTP